MIETKVRFMRGNGPNQSGLRDLCAHLSPNSVGVEVGSFAGESAAIFMQSGKLSKLTCVDYWPTGEWAEAEADFDKVLQRFDGQIEKIKEKSLNAVKQFATQSLDFCYIDANHKYEHVRDDIRVWRPKVRAGGIMAGHDYHPTKFPGVVQAVVERFGAPTATFADHSWMVKIPTNNFEIITYCTAKFVKVLAITLPTWIQQSGASRIVVYTDGPEVEAKFLAAVDPDLDRSKVIWRHHFSEKSDRAVESWKRKIIVLRHAYDRCLARFFCWLDADVLATYSFKEVFYRLGSAQLGVTRMFNPTNRGRGEANAGVIFFQHHPLLAGFFKEWQALSAELEKSGKAGQWFEQAAISRLAHDSFNGLKDFWTVPVSENLFNCEDDVTKSWLARIEMYRPKLVHFKTERWQDAGMVETVKRLAHQIEKHYVAKLSDPRP